MSLPAILSELKQGQWSALKAAITDGPPETAYEYMKLAVHRLGFNIRLGAATAGDDDVAGLIARGGIAYFLSGRARRGAVPDSMNDSQVDSYMTGLMIARESADAALALHPGHGLAAAVAMGCAIDPMDENHKADAESVLLASHDVPVSGHMNLMMALAEKWGGAHDDMFRIARSHYDPARPGSAALIARAHFERRLFYAAFDDAPDASDNYTAYFSPRVLDELIQASDRVLKARDGDPAELRLAHGWLAMGFFNAADNKRAARHLDRLRGFEDPTIWFVLPLPFFAVQAIARLRALLG